MLSASSCRLCRRQLDVPLHLLSSLHTGEAPVERAGPTPGHANHVSVQVFSLFDAITCGSFLKVLSDAHRQPSGQRGATRDAGSDADMDDADGADADASDARVSGDSEWCVEAVRAFADVLPLLSLKDQQDTLRRCYVVTPLLKSAELRASQPLCTALSVPDTLAVECTEIAVIEVSTGDHLPRSCVETFLEVARSPAAGAAVVDACHAALLALLAPCHGRPADTAAILLRHLTPAVLGVEKASQQASDFQFVYRSYASRVSSHNVLKQF